MDRQIIYTQEQGRSYDILYAMRLALYGDAYSAADITGAASTTVVTGLAASTTGGLSLNIGLGRIYQIAAVDSSTYGALAADATQVLQQGVLSVSTPAVFSTAGLTAGQSFYALVQAQFSQVDVIPGDDPTGGVLTYVNPANPTAPFIGPGGGGAPANTRRRGIVTLNVVYGAAATTGSQVPPNPTAGWVPLYLTRIDFAQTVVSTFFTAGPSVAANVPSNYPVAPFLAGLLNSHHNGTNGQAPQIKLASEVQGLLPNSNLSQVSSAGGSSKIPVIVQNFAGDPNGSVAGSLYDEVYDTIAGDVWICSTAGTTSTAVWVRVGPIQYNPIINGDCRVNQRLNATISTSFQLAGPDRWAAKGVVVTAGTIQQAATTNLGSSGYALQLAGVTTSGATGTVTARYRIESRDVQRFINQLATVGLHVYQDTGGAINYTIQINKATVQDNFTAVTTIATSGNISVPNTTDTLITFAAQNLGTCGNGVELQITAACGTVTTKNFYFTELQMRLGSVLRSFPYRTVNQETVDCQRYYEPCLTGAFMQFLNGVGAGMASVIWKVTKRIAPTSLTWRVGSVSAITPTNATITNSGISIGGTVGLNGNTTVNSGFTVGFGGFVTNPTAGSIAQITTSDPAAVDVEL